MKIGIKITALGKVLPVDGVYDHCDYNLGELYIEGFSMVLRGYIQPILWKVAT